MKAIKKNESENIKKRIFMKILVKRLDIGTIYNVNGKCLNNK